MANRSSSTSPPPASRATPTPACRREGAWTRLVDGVLARLCDNEADYLALVPDGRRTDLEAMTALERIIDHLRWLDIPLDDALHYLERTRQIEWRQEQSSY